MKEPPCDAVASENLARGHGSGKWIGQQQNLPLDCSYDVSRNEYIGPWPEVTTASTEND
jgi:hypothetical protein